MIKKRVESSEIKVFTRIVFGIGVVVTLYSLAKGESVYYYLLCIVTALMIIAELRPKWIEPFYIKWTQAGDIIGNIFSRVVLFVMFYGLFVPVSIVLRLLNKDPLRKKIDKTVNSYWEAREEPPGSMKNQF